MMSWAPLAEESLKRSGLKKGDRAMIWGLKRLEDRGRRARAMIRTLEEAGIVVDYIEISPEVDKDSAVGTPIITGYLSSHPDCKMMLIDHGALTSQTENFLRAAGIKPDDIFVGGFSLSPATATAIESGYVDLVSEMQPYLLGYLSVAQIVFTKKYGFTGLELDTGGGLVHKDNIGCRSAGEKRHSLVSLPWCCHHVRLGTSKKEFYTTTLQHRKSC